MIRITPGATNQTIDVFIQDSSSTTGAGLGSLVYNSSGLVCYYRRGATGTATALTLATQTVGGAHSDGGFVEIQSSNMPGMYRLDLSDAIVADGVDFVTIMLKGATNMAPCSVRVELRQDIEDYQPLQPSTPGRTLDVTSGGTAGIDWANVEAPTTTVNLSGTTVSAVSGAVGSVTGAVGSVTGAVGSVTGNVGGNVVGSVASVTGNVGGNVVGSVASVTGAVGSVTGNVGGNVVGSVASVTGAVGSVTGNVGGSVGSISGVTFPTNFGDLAITVTTGRVTVGTNNDKTGYSITGTITDLDSLNNITAADVVSAMEGVGTKLTEAHTAVTASRAEPGQGAPAASTDAMTKIDYVYKFLRNKSTQTATTMSIFNDAGTTVDHKSTVSDDGTTFTRGEIATGP